MSLSIIATSNLIMSIFIGLLILVMAMILDRLSIKLIKQTKSKKHISSQLSALRVSRSLLLFTIRIAIWSGAFFGVLWSIPTFQFLARQIESGVVSIPARIGKIWSTPFIELGRNSLSLSTLVTFVLATIALFLITRLFSQWFKRRILTRTKVDRGTQEAISVIVNYSLAILGFFILLQSIGFDLSSLTVLAGVLGIGLGLGLQELASNFVSGLTLLFEQQLRVGDFINVDDLLGTVERISIRSTIIRTQDQLFVIVPNHRFFQRNVINWSYQTQESRLHVPVHVAYGSDTILVTETLLVAARMEARVLAYPPPQVWFKAFGSSSYEFELLVWINQPQEFEAITSALNFLIEQELVKRGIEIPFPQQDLWIRTPQNILNPALGIGRSEKKSAHSGKQSNRRHQPDQTQERTLRVLLRQVSYFEKCTNAQLRVLIEQGYRQLFKTGDIICHEGEPGESFYIVLDGRVEISSHKIEQAIANLVTGDFFGEISALTGTARSATVQAVDTTTLFVVNRHALQQLLQEYNDLAEQIATALSQRQQDLQQLGILDFKQLNQVENAPFLWIRQRIQSIFGI